MRDLSGLDIQALRDSWPTEDEVEAEVRAAHEPPLQDAAVEQSLSKHASPEELEERLEKLKGLWPDLREKIKAQLMGAEELREMLRAAGCPTSPEEIGLSVEDFRATYSRARMIRSRYTVLDLAVEAGIFEECVEELFAPGGFWSSDTGARPRAAG